MRRVRERLSDLLADVRLLHGSLPPVQQDAAIAASVPPIPKVVLATDIAESSITVEGVGVVVDSGLARAPRFDPHTGMTRLQTITISRASADQRAGRAGRLGPGIAYRLWSKVEHAARTPHIEPEITQVDLAGLALELAVWGVSEPAELTWLDEPPAPAWAEAVDLLTQLGALTEGRITDLGRRMAVLPVHPRLARMVATADEEAALAVWLAALISERDPLRGKPGEVPVDLGLRIRLLVDETARHPAASPPGLARIRRTASDLARRAGVNHHAPVHADSVGRVLARAFPDRLAIRRGTPGRFQLRTGTTCFMAPSDTLAAETFLVAADLDGRRKDARIRLAAGIDRADVLDRFSHQIQTRHSLTWEEERLVDRTERRLGGIVLDRSDQRPDPGPETSAALTRRIRDRGIDALPWDASARGIQERVNHLHETLGDDWPDWSDAALRRTLDTWLAPRLAAATGWDDVQNLDMGSVLRSMLGHELLGRLGEVAPTHIVVPSGRRIPVDYSRDSPTVSVRVQEMFGSTDTPRIGGEPVVLELLSPANRPLQITSDLAGFWKGSWTAVRKEMAGRYPKHDWPEDPATVRP
jgi:ATP-dependent helicase HrpB